MDLLHLKGANTGLWSPPWGSLPFVTSHLSAQFRWYLSQIKSFSCKILRFPLTPSLESSNFSILHPTLTQCLQTGRKSVLISVLSWRMQCQDYVQERHSGNMLIVYCLFCSKGIDLKGTKCISVHFYLHKLQRKKIAFNLEDNLDGNAV